MRLSKVLYIYICTNHAVVNVLPTPNEASGGALSCSMHPCTPSLQPAVLTNVVPTPLVQTLVKSSLGAVEPSGPLVTPWRPTVRVAQWLQCYIQRRRHEQSGALWSLVGYKPIRIREPGVTPGSSQAAL